MRRSVQFRPGLVERLDLLAVEERRTVNWLINEAVEVFLGGGGVGSVPGPSESAGLSTGLPAGAVEERPKETRTPSQGSGRPLGGSQTISSPGEVPAAVERVAGRREFTPYSKEQQVGKVVKKAKAEPVASCRHGLLRCKVCGTL